MFQFSASVKRYNHGVKSLKLKSRLPKLNDRSSAFRRMGLHTFPFLKAIKYVECTLLSDN